MIPYPLFNKISAFIQLGYYKFTAPLECYDHRLKIWVNEFVFMAHALFKFRFLTAKKIKVVLVKTKFGQFLTRNTVYDLATISPAYERLDLNFLLSLVREGLRLGKKIVFLDIGADLGKYSITIGTCFKKYHQKIKIIAFEPDPNSYAILKKNIRINRLTNIQTHSIALSDRQGKIRSWYYAPMRMIVGFKTNKTIFIKTDTLDNYFKKISLDNNTVLFIKLDVEGYETKVLKGSLNTLAKSNQAFLMVEDVFHVPKLYRFLLAKTRFLKKISSQNSFWLRSN